MQRISPNVIELGEVAESSRKSGFQTEHEICPAVDGAAYMPGFGCPWLECMKILTNFRMYKSKR